MPKKVTAGRPVAAKSAGSAVVDAETIEGREALGRDDAGVDAEEITGTRGGFHHRFELSDSPLVHRSGPA